MSRSNKARQVTVEGRLVHDLRRTFARDMRRTGVSEGVVMKLAGWRTRSMFDRYNIIDEADLAQAVAQRFANGQVTAKRPPPRLVPNAYLQRRAQDSNLYGVAPSGFQDRRLTS